MEKKRVIIEKGEVRELLSRLEECKTDADMTKACDDFVLGLYNDRNQEKEVVKTLFISLSEDEDGDIADEVVAFGDKPGEEGWQAFSYKEKSGAASNTKEIGYIKARVVSELRREIKESILTWVEMGEKQHTTKDLPKGGAIWKQLRRTEAVFDTMEIDYKRIAGWLDVYEREALPLPQESPLKYEKSEADCLKHYESLSHLGLITCTGDEWLILCGLKEGETKPMKWGIPGRKEKDNIKDFAILLEGLFEGPLFERKSGWMRYIIRAFGMAEKESAIKVKKSRLKHDNGEKERLKYIAGI